MPTTIADTATHREIAQRISRIDWPETNDSLWARGHAVTPALLTPAECQQLIALYGDDRHFRSLVLMERFASAWATTNISPTLCLK